MCKKWIPEKQNKKIYFSVRMKYANREVGGEYSMYLELPRIVMHARNTIHHDGHGKCYSLGLDSENIAIV